MQIEFLEGQGKKLTRRFKRLWKKIRPVKSETRITSLNANFFLFEHLVFWMSKKKMGNLTV